MSLDTANQILADFSATLDGPEISFDEDRYVAIATGDRLGVNLYYVEETDAIVVITTVAEITEAIRYRLYEELLTANFLWEATAGATLSVTPELTHAMLQQVVDVQETTGESFAKLLDRHCRITMAWTERVKEIADDVAELDAAAPMPANDAPNPGQLV